MSRKRQRYDVYTGQIWQDRDKRMERRVCVVSTSTDGATATVNYRNETTGRKYKSRYDRFQSAFDLLAQEISGHGYGHGV